MNNVIYREEGKSIIDAFEKLTPWDKSSLIKYLVEHEMSEEEIEKYFIEGSGYVKYDDIDFAKEVVDNNLEYEIFDKFVIEYICDYIIDNSDSAEAIKYIFHHGDSDDIANAVSSLSFYDISKILKTLWKNNKNECIKILDNSIK